MKSSLLITEISGTSVHLLQDLGELAGNVRCVAIKHRRVAVGNLEIKMVERELEYMHKTPKSIDSKMSERYGVVRHRVASPHGNTHS